MPSLESGYVHNDIMQKKLQNVRSAVPVQPPFPEQASLETGATTTVLEKSIREAFERQRDDIFHQMSSLERRILRLTFSHSPEPSASKQSLRAQFAPGVKNDACTLEPHNGDSMPEGDVKVPEGGVKGDAAEGSITCKEQEFGAVQSTEQSAVALQYEQSNGQPAGEGHQEGNPVPGKSGRRASVHHTFHESASMILRDHTVDSAKDTFELFTESQKSVLAAFYSHIKKKKVSHGCAACVCYQYQKRKRIPDYIRRPLQWLLEHPSINRIITMLILTNAALMGMEADDAIKRCIEGWQAAHSSKLDHVIVEKGPEWYGTLDWAFAVVFTTELFFRLLVYDVDCFVGEDWAWNWLDTSVVLFCWIEISGSGSKESSNGSGGAMPPLRLFRLIRVLRSLRVIRSLRFFTELRLVLLSLLHSMKPLLWSSLCLCLIMFVFVNMFLDLFSDSLTHYKFDPSVDEQWSSELLVMFDSFGGAMITLLAFITGGIEWYAPYQAFLQINALCCMVLVIYMVLVTLGVLNVIAAVFVEVAISKAKTDRMNKLADEHELHKEMAGELVRVFHLIDLDKSGGITYQEWMDFIQTEAGRQFRLLFDVDIQQAMDIYKVLDVDDDNMIVIEEFVVGFMKINGSVNKLDIELEAQSRKKMLSRMYSQMSRLDTLVDENLSRLRFLETSLCKPR